MQAERGGDVMKPGGRGRRKSKDEPSDLTIFFFLSTGDVVPILEPDAVDG